MKNNHAQHVYLFIFTYLANGFIQCIQVMLSPGIEPLNLGVVSATLYQLSYRNKKRLLCYKTIF